MFLEGGRRINWQPRNDASTQQSPISFQAQLPAKFRMTYIGTRKDRNFVAQRNRAPTRNGPSKNCYFDLHDVTSGVLWAKLVIYFGHQIEIKMTSL